MKFLYEDPTVPQWYIDSLPAHNVTGTPYRQTKYPERSAESAARLKRVDFNVSVKDSILFIYDHLLKIFANY